MSSRCRGTGKARYAPQLVKKGQTRLEGFDEKILARDARGMTTRDIQAQVQELYGVEVSPALISNVTEAVMEEVRQWQSRPLEAIYPIVYLDCLVVPRQGEPAGQQQGGLFSAGSEAKREPGGASHVALSHRGGPRSG